MGALTVSSAPKTPEGLDRAGAELWDAIVGDVAVGWTLDARDLALLEAAARAADHAAELETAVDRDGLMIAGSKGQQRLHPAVAEARAQRQLMTTLIARVEIAPEGQAGLSDRQRDQLSRARQKRGRANG